MDASSQIPDAPGRSPRPQGAIPHRTHAHRGQERGIAVGAQPDPVVRIARMVASIGIGALVMLLVLVGAVKYLQRDWADKNRRARSQGRQQVVDGTLQETLEQPGRAGRAWVVSRSARERFLSSLAGTGQFRHHWLIQGLATRSTPEERRRAALLDLAENGDSVQVRNLHAALLLKQGDVLQAVHQLRTAERLLPGYAPTLFNRALCAMMTDLPEQALVWLVRYRARFPDEPQAVRLHFNLLVQLDRADDAMEMLDGFLATQPPSQPLLLDAAIQAARMNRVGDAIRYLEIAQRGQPPGVIARIYQSPAFREIRLSPEGTAFAGRLARKARASLAMSPGHPPMTAVSNASAATSLVVPAAPKFH